MCLQVATQPAMIAQAMIMDPEAKGFYQDPVVVFGAFVPECL